MTVMIPLQNSISKKRYKAFYFSLETNNTTFSLLHYNICQKRTNTLLSFRDGQKENAGPKCVFGFYCQRWTKK